MGKQLLQTNRKGKGNCCWSFPLFVFFSCLAAIGFYPLLFPNTFRPPKRPEKGGITFCFSLSLLFIDSSSFIYFLLFRHCSSGPDSMYRNSPCLYLQQFNYNLAYPQSGRLPMLQEIEGTWRNFLFPPLRNWLQGPSFPLRYMCVHAAPPSYYGQTHTRSHIPLFRRGKTINIHIASPAAALQQQASLIPPGSHTLHHKHTIGKGQRPSYYFGIERKKHGLANKFAKRTENVWPIRIIQFGRRSRSESSVVTCLRGSWAR